MMKILIIGASHGGHAALEAAHEQYPEATIQMIDQGAFQFHFDDTVELFPFTKAIALDSTAHKIVVERDQRQKELDYDKLILAPGSQAFVPPFYGSDLKGVSPMHTREEITAIRKNAMNPEIQNVVVIGGGYIGIGAADIFSQHGKNVTVIDTTPTILNTYLDHEFAEMIQEDLATKNVAFQLNELVQSIDGKEQVSSVTTNAGTYPADYVVIATGIRPNTTWLKDELTTLESGLIKVNEFMQTNIPDVFAVGDAIAVNYQSLQRTQSVALASNAQRQAEIAVFNLLKPQISYPGVLGTSAWFAGNYQFGATGLTDNSAEKAGISFQSTTLIQIQKQLHAEKENGKTVQLKLTYSPDTKEILGGQIIADGSVSELINILALALQAKMTLSQLAVADFYMLPFFNDQPHVINEAALKALYDIQK